MARFPGLHDDAEVRRGFELYVAFADVHLPKIAAAFSKVYAGIPSFAPMMQKLEPEALLLQNRASMERIRKGVVGGDWSEYTQDLENRGVTYANAGIAFPDWAGVFAGAQVAIHDMIFDIGPKDRDELRVILKGVGLLFDTIVQVIGRTYFETQAKRMAAQADALLDLSTPVLVVDKNILLVPLIGHIDARRGERLRTTLLGTLASQRARNVVVDLTGVAAVDTHAIAHVLRCIDAAKLMGARVTMSGLSADVCHAIVALGIDLRRTPTFTTLHDAIDDARA